MKTFIAISNASKKILKVAHMSSNLPVNVLILGEEGVGKKLLSELVLPDGVIFDALTLEELLIHEKINIDEYSELIVLNIQSVLNKKEFMEKLTGVKVVATANYISGEIEASFAIKIDIPPLNERKDDLDELINIYTLEAKEIYDIKENIKLDNKNLDLTTNGKSLKKSIYKSMFMRSLSDDEMMESFEYFVARRLKEKKDYRDLLKYFEIPLLKSAKKEFKSQLQMATNLNINRITLRKKLEQYFGE
jgi:DNA-binding NtrC family response regulator